MDAVLNAAADIDKVVMIGSRSLQGDHTGPTTVVGGDRNPLHPIDSVRHYDSDDHRRGAVLHNVDRGMMICTKDDVANYAVVAIDGSAPRWESQPTMINPACASLLQNIVHGHIHQRPLNLHQDSAGAQSAHGSKRGIFCANLLPTSSECNSLQAPISQRMIHILRLVIMR
jgi:hypothetical protein